VALLALGLVIIGVAIVAQADRLMPLLDLNRIYPDAAQTASGGTRELSALQTGELRQTLLDTESAFPGLTGWYFAFSLIPLALGIVAVWGAILRRGEGLVGNWLVFAMLLLTGTQLFSVFWPPHISPFLTAVSVLRLGVALSVIVGGIQYVRQIVNERATMLLEEKDRVRQLQELSKLNADFRHMVAHEIASPLGAIARMSEIIALGSLSSDQAATIAKRIQSEARLVQLLVADVRGTAEVERDDFEVRLQAVSVDSLLDEAEAYVRSRDGSHPFQVDRLHGDRSPDVQVLADPLRIGQVLRNLIGNALRHTAPGTPISLCTSLSDGRVQFVVTDQGPGIDADDQVRIFEKFGRGTETVERNVRGQGLGLYLSRRIVLAHGSDLRVDSVPGEYTKFWFTLEAVE
jgi:signal transduction histidine kinase